MPTINYQAVFTFLDRVDPVVLDMPEDKVAIVRELVKERAAVDFIV